MWLRHSGGSLSTYKILIGDVLEQLSTLPAGFFDASLSDPPYGLSFMGKEWDKGVPSTTVYEQLLRGLKPGAFAMAFGGTRTFHRLAVNIEDAGFEMRDCLSWNYGSGFPKSHNISKAIDKKAGAVREVVGSAPVGIKNGAAGGSHSSGLTKTEVDITAPATPAAVQWDGYGTALKPAWEPCLLVQKPLAGTFANNALTHGCGGLNIDGGRIGTEERINNASGAREGTATAQGSAGYHFAAGQASAVVGRFPANVIFDEFAGSVLDAMNDGASRFFYCAKVSTKERNAGCDSLAAVAREYGNESGKAAVEGSVNDKFTTAPAQNNHPTLKPLALTTYLAKLLLPPVRTDGQPRRIIVPFSGSGSEVIGCLLAGWDEVWGIEIDPAYVTIAHHRIGHHTDALPIELT